MKLLIDVGNTRLKWGLADNATLITTSALISKQITQALLVEVWQHLAAPDVLAIACVNSPHIIELICSVANRLWPNTPIVMAQSMAVQCGVHNAYTQPEKLGVDRWLALIAGYTIYQNAVCIADCGTAITVDLIDRHGYHQGGVICPGLSLMKQALSWGTHRLDFNDIEYEFGLANHTKAAIYNGTVFAACGLIERIVDEQTNFTQLILTGGNADLLAKQLRCPVIVDEHLVLRGLIYISG